MGACPYLPELTEEDSVKVKKKNLELKTVT